MTIGRQPETGLTFSRLVERHQLLVHADLVVAVLLAQLDHLRLQLLHLRHRPIGLVGEREEQQP